MSSNERWDYALIEWIWEHETIRLTFPNGEERMQVGSHAQITDLLTQLGHAGWEVASCAAAGNWLLWTLRRRV